MSVYLIFTLTTYNMKTTAILFLFFASFVACNSSQTDKAESPVTTTPASSENSATEEFALIKKYDCAVCHRKDEKLQGPAYVTIAQKYQGRNDAVAYLSKKIIEGGSGVWGEVPMNPHQGMPQSDAEELAKYVLSLK